MPLVVASKDKAFTPEAAAKAGKPVVLVLNGIHAGRDRRQGRLPDPPARHGAREPARPPRHADAPRRPDLQRRRARARLEVEPPEPGRPRRRDGLPDDDDGLRPEPRLPEGRRPRDARPPLARRGVEPRPLRRRPRHRRLRRPGDADGRLRRRAGDGRAAPRLARDGRTRPRSPRWRRRAGRPRPTSSGSTRSTRRRGSTSAPRRPRYGTGYMPLRGIPSILVENHALKPYGERVRANEAFLSALLSRVGKEPKPLKEARAAALRAARSAPARLPLRPRRRDRHLAPGDDRLPRLRLVAGRLPRHREAAARLRPVEAHEHPDARLPPREGERSRSPRPRGLPRPGGLATRSRRGSPPTGSASRGSPRRGRSPVGTYRASDAKLEDAPYQGRVRRQREDREGDGDAHGPGRLALRPARRRRSPPWRCTSSSRRGPTRSSPGASSPSALEMKEYIDPRVLDPLAREDAEGRPEARARSGRRS